MNASSTQALGRQIPKANKKPLYWGAQINGSGPKDHVNMSPRMVLQNPAYRTFRALGVTKWYLASAGFLQARLGEAGVVEPTPLDETSGSLKKLGYTKTP